MTYAVWPSYAMTVSSYLPTMCKGTYGASQTALLQVNRLNKTESPYILWDIYSTNDIGLRGIEKGLTEVTL